MKHRVVVEEKVRKRFLGIPYETVEKRQVMVDGRTYRRMKQEEKARMLEARVPACAAALMMEEEMVDMFGE